MPCFALARAGYETIMINCNPETVSTDYDTADRLYFEPLTSEDVLESLRPSGTERHLARRDRAVGGQTPLKLATRWRRPMCRSSAPRLTPIDLAEDRDRFKRVLDKLRLKQPKNGIAYSVEQARLVAADLGLPLVVRPSYVLGGRAMQIIREETQLSDYLLGTLPELVPGDVKARYPNEQDRPDQYRAGHQSAAVRPLSVRRHRDRRRLPVRRQGHLHRRHHGAHRGSRHSLRRFRPCSLPPHSLDAQMISELERQTRELALGLDVVGLMNVQYAIKDGDIYVLEVNPRASRTVPFVRQVMGMPVAKIAARSWPRKARGL